MVQPYDPKKAELFNKLRQQGLSEGDAADQAGLRDQIGEGTYVITGKYFPDPPGGKNPNPGTMGAPVEGTQKVAGRDFDRPSAADQAESDRFDRELDSSPNFEQVDYQVAAKNPPSKVTPINTVTTSTETVSGGGSTTTVSGPRLPTATSQALQPAINAKQAELDQFRKDNPGDYARKQQGLPPLSKEESDRNIAKVIELKKERDDLQKEQRAAESTTPPTVTTVPNTTTTTQTVTTGTAATNQQVDPLNDEKLSQESEEQLLASPSLANGSTARSAAPVAAQTTVDEFGQVVPAADPVSPEDDPFEQSRLDAEQQLNDEPIEFDPADVDPEDDPFEAERLEREQELNRQELSVEANEPEPLDAEQLGNDYGFTSEETEGADPVPLGEPAPVELSDEEILARQNAGGLSDEEILARNPEPVNVGGLSDEEILARRNPGGLSDEEILDRQANAAQKSAINQATQQARYKQPQNDDWRVRLSLSIGANYLYKDPSPGILAPLVKTDGVIFPYTPTIDTSYVANYTKTDLVHSNYRGAFYQNSSVQDVNIRGMFTAQDTSEAQYMLAVIHFFRSVTKMFYGKDPQRGAPPPLVYLSGFGDYQFAGHPCVVTNFAYTLPSDVDYIRANNPNNYGTELLNRREAALSSPTPFSGQQARQDILKSVGVFFGAPPSKPTQSPVTQTVTNINRATYVPTKIEISITLLPMQTRDQISKQFSVKDFANGKLIQGGFW